MNTRKLSALLLRLMGWTVDSGIPSVPKCILLGAPHTSILDFVVAFLYYHSHGGNAKCMVKQEIFATPLAPIIRAMGGIPVDRQNPTTLLRSVIHQFQQADTLHLAIAPEGTRKPVRHWKTGFHLIARAANVPVYLAYFDWGTKHVGYFAQVELTDDPHADLRRIQQMYADRHLVGRHPSRYIAN